MSEETTKIPISPVMADTESEIKVETTAIEEITKGQNSKTASNASDYDSADSYSDRENGSLSGSDSDASVIIEREEGDGQESTPAKKVDDDEDKKNPQYIPKRGTFYEHDDRTADDIESPEAEKIDKDNKKKVWQDKKEKWSHDRFDDTEQAPKSRSELVSIYGYDIRNEDGPPRARRRRRYGRGPNKYTRNWEDGDAYGKPTVIRKTPKKQRPKSQGNDTDSRDQDQDQDQSGPETNEGGDTETVAKDESDQMKDQRIPNNSNEESKPTLPQSPPRPQQQHRQHQQQSPPQPKDTHRQNIPAHHYSDNKPQSNKNSRFGTGRVSKPKREIADSDYRGFTKSRQFKSSPPTRPHGRNSHNPNANPNNGRTVQEIEKEMGRMTINEGFKPNPKHNQRQGSMPPRLQTEQKGSKRYSSIRQRSLPETTNPPFQQHANYYGNEFNQPNPTSQPQPTMITNNTIHPTNAQLPQIPTQTLPPIPAQVPVTTTPILQAPPQFAPPFTPAPPFLQPGVPPASFIPQPTPPILNYVQGQPPYPQPPYQGFQQPFNAVNPPTELYQPQGGITYYSTQEQQAAQRAVPPKRPKAAIPIVAPPEHRGRGRMANQMDPATNAEGYDNLTEIVENAAQFEDIIETAAQS